MKTLFAATVALMSVTFIDTAFAKSYGWCLNTKEDRGGTLRCTFSSRAQCMASRSSNGEWCMRNPRR